MWSPVYYFDLAYLQRILASQNPKRLMKNMKLSSSLHQESTKTCPTFAQFTLKNPTTVWHAQFIHMIRWNTDLQGIFTFDVSLQVACLQSVSEPWGLKEKQSSYCSSAKPLLLCLPDAFGLLADRRFLFSSIPTAKYCAGCQSKTTKTESHSTVKCQFIVKNIKRKRHTLNGLFISRCEQRKTVACLSTNTLKAAFTISWPLGNLLPLVFIPHRRGHPRLPFSWPCRNMTASTNILSNNG